jgi:6-phosphogluconolactonase (cycloisomerase 2 family)
LSGYNIDPNIGSLAPLSGSPFAPGLSAPTSVATYTSIAGPGLYITNLGVNPGSISAFTVDASGTAFANIAGSPYAAQLGPTAGLFFFGGGSPTFNAYYLETDSSSNAVSVYLVNSTTGALSAVLNSPFPAGTGPGSVASIQTIVNNVPIDHAYVANSGAGTIFVYSMDTQTGTLAALPAATVNVGSGLSTLLTTAGPTTAGAYLLATASRGVLGFSTDATGALVPLPNSPFAAGAGPGPIATLGNYVYVVNTVDQTISAFIQTPASGQLTPIAGAPVKTGRTPSSIVVIARPPFG